MPAAGPATPIIAGYTFQSPIAQGRASTVWRAVEEAGGRTVAIKVVPITEAIDAARFLREAQALRGLDHPNVVRCLAAGRQEQVLYLVMEYLPGGDVATLIQRALVAESTALGIARDAAAGLEALDRAGLTHRDIAPGNILLDHAGMAKIGDFGLVRTAGGAPLTRTGEILGTPAYAAPEQVRAVRDADGRSDIYAVGAMLYALVTGSPPFTGSTMWAVLEQVEHAPRPDPRILAPTVSPQARAIIQCAMALSPADRYQHPSELHEDLIAVLGGGVPRNAGRRRPAGLLAEAGSAAPWWSTPTPSMVGFGMLGAAVLGLLLGYAASAVESPDQRAARAAREAHRSDAWTAYLARFPDGQARPEATASIQLFARLDDLADQLRSGDQRQRDRDHAGPAAERPRAAPAPPPAPLPTPLPAPLPARPQAPSAAAPGSAGAAAAPGPALAAGPASPAPSAAARTAAAAPQAAPGDAALAEAQRPLQRVTINGVFDFTAAWCHPSDARTILLWSDQGKVWRTGNGAASWDACEIAGGLRFPLEHAYGDAAGKVIFIPSRGPLLGVISSDGGAHFRAVPPPWPGRTPPRTTPQDCPPFQTLLTSSGLLVVCWKNEAFTPAPWTLEASSDLGASWSSQEISEALYCPLFPGPTGAFLYTFDGPSQTTRVSSDLGRSWRPINPLGRSNLMIVRLPFATASDRLIILDPTHGSRLIEIGQDGLLSGVQPLDPRLAALPSRIRLMALAIDPGDPRILYLACTGVGLARSLDRGATWACSTAGFAPQFWAGVQLSFTAGAAQRLVMTTRKEVIFLDDHLHLPAMFPLALDTLLADLTGQQPR